jgi:uncharacterized protein YqeY
MELMSLKVQIQKDIRSALKAKEGVRLSTLRFLNAQIQNAEIEKGRQELTDEEIIKLINSQIKKLKESLALFEKGKRNDLIKKTREEIKILKKFLPQQLSDEELAKEIQKIIDENPDFGHPGALIGLAIKKLAGRADNQRIAQIIKEKFNPQ